MVVEGRLQSNLEILAGLKNEIEKLDPVGNKLKIANREADVKILQSSIEKDRHILEDIQEDIYYDLATTAGNKLNHILEPCRKYTDMKEPIPADTRYAAFLDLQGLKLRITKTLTTLEKLEDPYPEFGMRLWASGYVDETTRRLLTEEYFLPGMNQYQELVRQRDYYQNLLDHLIADTYEFILEKAGVPKNKENKKADDALKPIGGSADDEINADLEADLDEMSDTDDEDQQGEVGYLEKHRTIEASPYLYTQILYQLLGAPDTTPMTLISIDEAQGLAPEELNLIDRINKHRAVFNLYGDVKQHIEGTKGVDSWSEFTLMKKCQRYYLDENYRNAKEITRYCNDRFNMKMLEINLPGNGVVVCKNPEKSLPLLRSELSKRSISGLRAIIVKDALDIKDLRRALGEDYTNIQRLRKGDILLSRTKWNLMTVAQAKGIEFNSVIVIDSRMTEHEKYISYTRALDRLLICEEIPRPKRKSDSDTVKKTATPKTASEEAAAAAEKTATPQIDLDETRREHAVESRENQTRASRVQTPQQHTSMAERITAGFQGLGRGLSSLFGRGNTPADNSRSDAGVASDSNTDVPADRSSELAEYYRKAGFPVIDYRDKKGALWVIGEKDALEPYVKEAVKKYGCTGAYASGKATNYRNGWYTKSEK